jgi:hypothetical protein
MIVTAINNNNKKKPTPTQKKTTKKTPVKYIDKVSPNNIVLN